jgi:hypothetical protein
MVKMTKEAWRERGPQSLHSVRTTRCRAHRRCNIIVTMPRNEAAAFQTLLAWDDDDDYAEQYDYSRRRAFAALILGITVIARQRRKQRRWGWVGSASRRHFQ